MQVSQATWKESTNCFLGGKTKQSISPGKNRTKYHYDNNGNMDCRGVATSACVGGDKITWYSFNKPNRIDYGADYARFVYGPNRQRIKQINNIAGPERTTYYVGPHFQWDLIFDTTTTTGTYRYRSTVFANGRAVYWIQQHVTNDGCSISLGSEAFAIFRDHQENVDRMILDVGSGSDQSYSFDVFGKRRNVTGWTADTNDVLLDTDHMTKRGYTGHEHLDNVQLIHMNGRVQDPIMGRMLSPDPLLGNLMNPQTLNPYSYVENRPATLVDPSGFNSGAPGEEMVITAERYYPDAFVFDEIIGPLYSPSTSMGAFGGGAGSGGAGASGGSAVGNDAVDPPEPLTKKEARRLKGLGKRGKGCRPSDCILIPGRDLAKLLNKANAYLNWANSQGVLPDPTGSISVIDGVAYGDGGGELMALNSLPQEVVDAAAGFGDVLSFGITALIREVMGTNEVVDFSSSAYLSGAAAGVAVHVIGFRTGGELSIGRNWRVAPWGNRTGSRLGRFPHYHRGGPKGPNGERAPGQGIGRHRPWEGF